MKPAIPASSTLPASPTGSPARAAFARAGAEKPKLSVIIPARDEEANIGRCLRSILAQQGIAFQVIVVDDHSTDRTAEIARQVAQEFAAAPDGGSAAQSDACQPGPPTRAADNAIGCGGLDCHARALYISSIEEAAVAGVGPAPVIVIEARRPLPAGWTGKANAISSALPHAESDWLLFTDADTEHAPGSLSAAVREAEQHGADLLSLSPEQQVEGFWERALMPVIFAELATAFRPRDVSDPTKSVAAANGQYLLIRRAVYQAVGGHAAVAADLLEDVALARRVKGAGYVLRFRLGKGMVRTRMYRGLRQMREGWTKNLALLFPDAGSLAYRRLAEFAALVALPPAAAALWLAKAGPLRYALLGAAAVAWGNFLRRTRQAHFDPLSSALAFCGLPLFASLLLRSARAHRNGQVEWKGRNYCVSPASAKIEERCHPSQR
jgi:glycosyltransferase involved in cell wall biosynthesis